MPLSSSSHSPRPDYKGNSMFCALRVHKFGPETQSRDPSRERLCARESHGDCHLFAIAGALPSPTIFAFCSLNVKLIFCPIG
jgi:hypothetical protein